MCAHMHCLTSSVLREAERSSPARPERQDRAPHVWVLCQGIRFWLHRSIDLQWDDLITILWLDLLIYGILIWGSRRIDKQAEQDKTCTLTF